MLRFAIGMDSLLSTFLGAGVHSIKTFTSSLSTGIATQSTSPLLPQSYKESRFRVFFTSSK